MADGFKGSPNNREDFLIFVKSDHLYTVKIDVFY